MGWGEDAVTRASGPGAHVCTHTAWFISVPLSHPSSLGVEPVDRDTLGQPPRSTEDTILSRALLLRILMSAATIISGTLFVFWREVSGLPGMSAGGRCARERAASWARRTPAFTVTRKPWETKGRACPVLSSGDSLQAQEALAEPEKEAGGEAARHPPRDPVWAGGHQLPPLGLSLHPPAWEGPSVLSMGHTRVAAPWGPAGTPGLRQLAGA